jgi:23S rRNA pseudouridine2605 synthase
MRLNKFIAQASGHSRRVADDLIASGRVSVNGQAARLGQSLAESDVVKLDDQTLQAQPFVYLLLHKPVGYVCSRHGQGASTIFELLPEQYQTLNGAGRLDKDTSGLILLSNDGDWAQALTHPSQAQAKVYELTLDKSLAATDRQRLLDGVELADGMSRFDQIKSSSETQFEVTLHGGRNRQIRRSLAALGYKIFKLHRIQFGPYSLGALKSGEFKEVEKE